MQKVKTLHGTVVEKRWNGTTDPSKHVSRGKHVTVEWNWMEWLNADSWTATAMVGRQP